MNLREKIEDNLAIWLLGALFSGFVGGIGAYRAVLEMAQLEVISKAKLEALQSAQAQDDEGITESPPVPAGEASESGQAGPAGTPARSKDSQPTDSSAPSRPGGTSERSTLSQKLPVFEAEASSFRKASLNFPPRNVINNIIRYRYDRSWQSDSGDLKGAWLELHLPEQRTVNKIRMYMLVAESSRGGQIRDAKLSFSDGSEQEARFPFEQGWQSIDLSEAKRTDIVRIEVMSVYPGDNGANNLEVAEIELYGE